MSRRCTWVVWTAAIAALAVKALLAWNTYGTNDVSFREAYLVKLRSAGALELYRNPVPTYYAGKLYKYEPFNQPPLAIALIDWWARMADWTGVPFRTMLRLWSSIADALSLLVVVQLVRRVRGMEAPCVALIAMAACPVSIFVSGFHGNSDPIMMLLVVLSLYGLEVLDSPAVCGLALGLAIEIKIVPAILVLALLLYVRSWRGRMVCAGTIALAAILPALPYLLADPGEVARKVLGYRSFPGAWGVTALLNSKLQYEDWGRFVLVGVLVLVSIWLNYPRPRARLFDQWGILFFLFLLLTPGFGTQYLAWLVPWVITLGPVALAGQYILNSVYIFIVYTHWSGGLPWYFANSLEEGAWTGWLVLAQLPVWGSIIPTLMTYKHRLPKPRSLSEASSYKQRQ